MPMPSESSVSSDRSFFRRLTSDTSNRAGAKRGIIQAKRRLTPCIRDPSHPRWSQTCSTLSRRVVVTTSDPSPLTVPRERPADAFLERDDRSVAQLGPRPGGIERPALGAEVDAPAVDRRPPAGRPTDGYADSRGPP